MNIDLRRQPRKWQTETEPRGFDPAGNEIRHRNFNNVVITNQFDMLSRLTNVVDARLTGDAAGNLQRIQYPCGITNAYQYNSLNRLTNLVWKLNGATVASFHYQVGLTGNRTNLNEAVSASSRSYAWRYDALYRLTNEVVSGTSPTGNLGYGLDPVGNRTTRSGSLGTLGSQSFGYSSNDWLSTDVYDNDGNTRTNASNQPYFYDYEDRLTNFNNGHVVITYNADGQRVRKVAGGVTTLYLVDTLNPSGYAQVLEELTVSGAGTNLARAYSYGVALISQRQPGVTTNFYGLDGHGSVRFLLSPAGVVTDTYTYDAYGNLIAFTGTTANNYLYCGEQWDPDLGMYFLRARYYNPQTGRFWTQDSKEGDQEEPKSLHLYLFCEADPVDNSDSTGNDVVGLDDLLFMAASLDQIGAPFVQLPRVRTQMDVYVWHKDILRRQSFGHVMVTEHNSSVVVLSQFPFTKKVGGKEGVYRLPPQGYNRTVTYQATFQYEGRGPNHRYVVIVPDSAAFYRTALQQRAATYWNWDPTTPDQTQCSTSTYLSLKAGKVPFGKSANYTSGTLLPDTFDGWMTEDSNSKTSGVTAVNPTSGR